MHNLISFFLLLVTILPVSAQIVFWNEDFENGCGSGCSANGYSSINGVWSIVTNNPDEGCGLPDYPNVWYVSCAENGNLAGVCGSGCASDESLHIGSTSGGDGGANYDAGGYCPYLGWPGTQSDTRCYSPIIDCSGLTNITLSFVYMEFGSGTSDNATLWYFDGSSWSQISDPAKTACCGGTCNGTRQGLWTAYSIALPASANNNPSVRIGFRWVNNDDMTGTDPSFAVDDIQLSSPAPMPIELTSFVGNCYLHQKNLYWSTASETNNDYFEIEQSFDGVQFETIGIVQGAGNSSIVHQYSFIGVSGDADMYFRLRQVDYDGSFSLSAPVFVTCNSTEGLQSAYLYYNSIGKQIEFQNLPIDQDIRVVVSNMESQLIDEFIIKTETDRYIWSFADPAAGFYLVSLYSASEAKTIKLIVN